MAYENFDYQGFLRDLGYPEEQIPQEFTDEQKEQVFTMAAHTTYKSYLEREQAMFPMLDKKEAKNQALDRLLQDAPMFREPLGIPEEITDRNEPYRLENFDAFIKATYPGQTNLGESAENYINSYTDFIYNDNVRYKRPFLRDVDKKEFAKHFKAANNIDKDTTVDDVFRTVDASKTPRQVTPHYAVGELKKLEGWKGSFIKLGDDLMPFSGTSQWRKSWNDFVRLLGDFTGSDTLRERGLYGQSAYAERERQQNYVPHYTKSLSEAYQEIVSEAGMNAALEDPDANKGVFGNLGSFGRLKMLWRMVSDLAPHVGELAVSNAAPTIGILATDILAKMAVASVASGGVASGTGAAVGALTGIRKAAQFLNKSRALTSVPGIGASALFMLPEAANEARELGLYREQDAAKALVAGGVITGLEYLGAMASIGFGTWGQRIGSEGAQTFWKNFMGEFPDITKMTFAKNAWKQNAKLLAGTVGNVVGDASAEGLTEGIQRAVSMAFSESIGGHYSWEDYIEEGLSDYFVGLTMSAPISGTGVVGRGFARAANFKKTERAKAEARAWLEQQRENLSGFSQRKVLSHLAHARFTNAAGEEVTVVSGAGVTGRGANTLEAVVNLVRNANARKGNNAVVDSSTIIPDLQNSNRASIQYGNGLVTYNSINGDAVTKLAALVAEHNDGTNSLFTFSEGMTITEVRNPLNPSQIEYEVKFDAEPQARGVFSNLYHPAVLDSNFGNFASNTHIITDDAVRNNPLTISTQDERGTLNLIDVEENSFDRNDVGYTILGKEANELVLFDESRGIVFTIQDRENSEIELSARTIYGRTLEVPENLQRQNKRTGITVDASYGIGAESLVDATGKQSWRFDVDKMENQLSLAGIVLDRQNSTSEHIEAVTSSGKTLTIDVDATNGNIFPFYQGQLLFNPNLNTRAFEISDVTGFPTNLEPHRANFGSWSKDTRLNTRTDATLGRTGFLKTFQREDGFTFQYDITLDNKGNVIGIGRFTFDYESPNVTWSNVKAFLQNSLGTNGRVYQSKIEEGYIITTNEGTPRYFNLIDYDETTRVAHWGNWIEDINRVLNVYPLGAEADLVAKIEELSNPNITLDYAGDGVQIGALRFVRFLSYDGKRAITKKLFTSDESLPISFLGITIKDIVSTLSPNEIDTIRRIATNTYQMNSLSPVEREIMGLFFNEIENPGQTRQQTTQTIQSQSNFRGSIYDDSDVIYDLLDDEGDVLFNRFDEPLQSKADRSFGWENFNNNILIPARKSFDEVSNNASLSINDVLSIQEEIIDEFLRKSNEFFEDELKGKERRENAIPTAFRYAILNFIMMSKVQRALTRFGVNNFSRYRLETKNVVVRRSLTDKGGWDQFIGIEGTDSQVTPAKTLREFFELNKEVFNEDAVINKVSNSRNEQWNAERRNFNKLSQQTKEKIGLEIVYRLFKDDKLVETFIPYENVIQSSIGEFYNIQEYIRKGHQVNRDIEDWFWGENGEITGEVRKRFTEQISPWDQFDKDFFKRLYAWIEGVNFDENEDTLVQRLMNDIFIFKKGQGLLDRPIADKYNQRSDKTKNPFTPIYTTDEFSRLKEKYKSENPSVSNDVVRLQESFNKFNTIINRLSGRSGYQSIRYVPVEIKEDTVFGLEYQITSNGRDFYNFQRFVYDVLNFLFTKYQRENSINDGYIIDGNTNQFKVTYIKTGNTFSSPFPNTVDDFVSILEKFEEEVNKEVEPSESSEPSESPESPEPSESSDIPARINNEAEKNPRKKIANEFKDWFFSKILEIGGVREDIKLNIYTQLRNRMKDFLNSMNYDELKLFKDNVFSEDSEINVDVVYTFAKYDRELQLKSLYGEKNGKPKELKADKAVNQSEIYTIPLDDNENFVRRVKEGYTPQVSFRVTVNGTSRIFRTPRYFLNELLNLRDAQNFQLNEENIRDVNLNKQNINVYMSYNVRPVTRKGYGNYFSQATDSMSPASFRTIPLESELKDVYGDDQIDAWLDSEHLVIVPTQEAAIPMLGESAELVYSADGYIQGFYDGLTNRIVLVEDGIADGEAHKVMVHERGLHANRLGLRNTEDFQAVLRYIEEHRGDDTPEGQAIRDAYDELPDFIPEQNRTEEALGKILDTMSDAVYNIAQRFINAIKRFLYRYGWFNVESFTFDDFVMMARVASRANVKDSMLRNGTYYPYVGGEPLSEEYQANIEEEAVQEFGPNVLDAISIINTQNEAETIIARLREQGRENLEVVENNSIFYRADPDNIYSVSPRGTKTKIERSDYGVGKRIGKKIYFHADYASAVVPTDILTNALQVAQQQGFQYNTMMYDEGTNAVRFDESKDFDFAREPSPGRMLTVYPDGRVTRSKTDQIFHHKWLWVTPDYSGFDTAESQAWSATWLKANEGKSAPSGYTKQWNSKLRQIGLGEYVQENEHDIQIRFSQDGLIQGFYYDDKVYLVRDGIAEGYTVPVLMHEIGDHAADLGFLEDEEYNAILDSLRRRRDRDADVQRAVQRALESGEQEDSPSFWREVSAYLVEEHGKSTSGLVTRILNFFKKVLFRMGILNADRFSTDDLALFAYSATKAWIGKNTAGRTSGDILLSRQSSRSGITDVNVDGLDNATAKSKMYYEAVRQNFNDIFTQARSNRLNNLQDGISSLGVSSPNFYTEVQDNGGGITGFINTILRSNIDVLTNPVIQRLIVDSKLLLNDIVANITQSTPDKVAGDNTITLEHLKAVAEAVEGKEFTRLEEDARDEQEVLSMRTNKNIIDAVQVPQAQSYFDYVMNETRRIVSTANDLFQYTPIENSDGSLTPALSNASGQVVARFDGLNIYDAPLAMEHILLKTRVGEGRRPSDVEQPDPFFYEKLRSQAKLPADFGRTVSLLDDEFVAGVIDSLPQHIKAKIHIHKNKDNPMTKRLLVDTNSYGVFIPLVPDPALRGKTIHIRAFDISPEEFIRTVSEEVGHFSWQMLATPEMAFVMDDIFELFKDAVIAEIPHYLTDRERAYKDFGFRGDNVYRKTVLLNELFSKNAINIMDKRYDGTAFQQYGITQEKLREVRKKITDAVRDKIAVKMNTAIFSSFFDREGQPTAEEATERDFTEFFTNYFTALMSPAAGKSIIYSLPNLAGGETQIRLNDWGQIRRTIPPSREAQVRAEIKEMHDLQDSDLMKRLVIWRYENLPLNLHLNWLRNLLPKKYGWISMPHGRLGDTVIGADVSIMLARAFQALNDDSGLFRRRQFTETIQFANYVRAHNLDPDLIDKSKGYVKFMEENELRNEKMLKLAEEFDKMLAQGREQINNNVLRIQDEFQKTIEALEVWAQRMGLDWQTLNEMKKEVIDMSERFRTEYIHRTYRAFTPEDHDNLVEMRNYLLEDDPDQFLSTKKEIAEREIAKLQNDYVNGRITTKRELRKRIEPHQHILDIYKRMMGLRTYAEGIVTGVYENWRNDPDATSFVTSYHESSIHGRMLHTINGILNRNMNTERERRKSNAEIEHSKFALISGVLGSGKLSRTNYYESAYMDFLGEVTNPVENLMLSLDQQEKVISKLAFNRMLGEKILAYGMGRFKSGIEGEMLPGIKKISKNETGTFLSFIKLDEFFDREFEREYDVIAASTNTLNSPYINYYKALRANLTIYNPKLIASNYISNISMLAVSGHMFNIANVFKGMPVIAESWMRQIAGKSKNDSEFVNQILKEMQEHQVFGGSSSSTEMRTYSHNVNERFAFFFVDMLKKAHLMSRQGEFKWKTWIENVYETAREMYGYGDEWTKVIAYINNRAVQMAKFESELDPTDSNFEENVRQAAAKEAADITKLETTTWELTPMEIRRLSGANFRLLTGDFIMHNFQIMRITAAWVGRFLEAMKEWRRLAALPVKTEAQERYQSLVGREAARRGVGLALGGSFASLIMKGATYPMSFLISALLGVFKGDGDDDKEFEEGEIRGLTAGEREGFQMMLNSTMSGDNMWAPFAKTGKYTFLATNDPRQHAALSLMSPPVPSENPSLWERIQRQRQQIINIAGDNILGETYNALRGKDRYGQNVGYWKTGWNVASRFLFPEAANQVVFAGDALWSWSTGGDLKGRTVNDMVMGYERKQTLGQMAFSLLGAGVREYDVRDLVTSMGYQMKQHTANNTNYRRRDFIQKVIRNPGASDSTIASDVADMIDYNRSLMDKSMYNIRAARTAGVEDKNIINYLSHGRNAPDTTVMSQVDSEKLTKSENIYDHHIITALERQRKLFSDKFKDDSKYTREQRAEIVATIDRYLERYKAAMGEGKYLPQNSKSSRRSESPRPTGNTRYNRLSVGDGKTRIINVVDGDTFDVVGSRGEQYRVRLADVDAFESGQGAVGWDARSRMSALINGASNIEIIPRYTDKYGRVVAEIYADGVNLSSELLKGGHGILYNRYARNADVLDMVRRGEVTANNSAINPQEYRRQQ